MTASPSHESDLHPFWEVQVVFDPDGGGAEFAYTIGLHTRGLPELHIWAHPSLGDDPGADWMLSTRDRAGVLNELAALLVEGRLGVGSELTREYDDGHARVGYHVGPPGDREQLQAFGVPDGVPVLPVRWSLHRPPEGPLGPLTAAAEREATELYERIVEGLPGERPAPRGWALPGHPSFEPEQPFGPLTPVVLARAAQLWQADDDTVADLLRATASVEFGHRVTWSLSIARVLARPCGRRPALEHLHDRAGDLVDRLAGAPAAGRRWRSIVRAVDPTWWDSMRPADRKRVARNFLGVLHDVTRTCLAVEAVADVADPALLLAARGPWARGMSGDLLPATPEWEASAEVVAAVEGLLRPLDGESLLAIGRMHRLAMTLTVADAEAYPDVCDRLVAWATVSAAVYPRRSLERLPGWGATAVLRAVRGIPGAMRGAPGSVVGLPGAVGGGAAGALGGPASVSGGAAATGGAAAVTSDLHDWATCLASALTHRGRLSAEDIRVFCLLPGEILPGLEPLLNSPV